MKETNKVASNSTLHGSLGFLVNALARLMRLELERQLEPSGMSPTHWVTLTTLGDEDRLSQTEISRRGFLDGASTTRAIDVLEARGLLTRTRNESDRRVQFIELTDAGREMLKTIAPVAPAVNDAITSILPAKARAQFEETLWRLVSHHLPSIGNDGHGS